VGHGPTGSRDTIDKMDRHEPHNAAGLPPLAEEAQPRCGATLDGVTRPIGILVPRGRPAPDGRKSGGRQPTEIRRINRRIYWLRLFRWTTSPRGPEHEEHGLSIFTLALDIGSHINALHRGISLLVWAVSPHVHGRSEADLSPCLRRAEGGREWSPGDGTQR
jgi:hypothetical protein